MQCGGRRSKAKPQTAMNGFIPFSKPSPFFSTTEWLSGLPTNDENPPSTADAKLRTMDENSSFRQKIHEEFTKFEKTMEELYLLKRVASDLKSYRKMIRLKKYD
jgi:hypothetical protein